MNQYWDVYSYATGIANAHSISAQFDMSSTRKRRRPAHLEDTVITESVGSREPMTASSNFKTSLYFPVVDQFIIEMNERFNHLNSIVMKGIATCSLCSSAFLTFEDMKPFSFMYGIDVATSDIEVALFSKSFATLSNSINTMTELVHSCLPAYQYLYDTVQIALTITVTRALDYDEVMNDFASADNNCRIVLS